MKKIIIEHSMIKQHDKIDIGLLTEGFIFNEVGLIIMHIGDIEKFKIGLQFFPDRRPLTDPEGAAADVPNHSPAWCCCRVK